MGAKAEFYSLYTSVWFDFFFFSGTMRIYFHITSVNSLLRRKLSAVSIALERPRQDCRVPRIWQPEAIDDFKERCWWDGWQAAGVRGHQHGGGKLPVKRGRRQGRQQIGAGE